MSDSNITDVATLAKDLEDLSNSLHELFDIAMNPGLSTDNYVSKTW